MKRYSINSNPSRGYWRSDCLDVVEDEDGPWVCWSDHLALLRRLEASLLVVEIARKINRGPFEDVRMTGVLAAFDAVGEGDGHGNA